MFVNLLFYANDKGFFVLEIFFVLKTHNSSKYFISEQLRFFNFLQISWIEIPNRRRNYFPLKVIAMVCVNISSVASFGLGRIFIKYVILCDIHANSHRLNITIALSEKYMGLITPIIAVELKRILAHITLQRTLLPANNWATLICNNFIKTQPRLSPCCPPYHAPI